MTQKVHLSFDRRIRNREVSAAIQYGGGSKGWISNPGERLVEDSEGDLPTGGLGTFDHVDTDGLTLTIGAGEAVVEGAYIATDETFDVELDAETANQTVYVGWRDGLPDTITVGLDSAFGGADHQIPVWEFDTDETGVITSRDIRDLGQTLSTDRFNGADMAAAEEGDVLAFSGEGAEMRVSHPGNRVFVTDVGDEQPAVGRRGDVWYPLADGPVEDGGDEIWTFSSEDSFDSGVAARDGVVYAADGDISFYAFDAVDGSVIWQFEGAGGLTVSNGVDIDAERVYFGTSADTLHALDISDGGEEWEFETDGQIAGDVVVSGGVVFFGSRDNNFYAVDAENGDEIWSFDAGDSIDSGVDVSDGVVYFGDNGGGFYALETSTGEEKWSFQTADRIESGVLKNDGRVYFGSLDDNFYAVDADNGDEIWSFETSTGDFTGNSSGVDVGNGLVYFGSDDGNLYALDASTGEKKWSFDTGGRPRSDVVSYLGAIFVGIELGDGSFYAVDAENGDEIWSFETGDDIGYGVGVLDGNVFFGSNDNNFYAVNNESGERYEQPRVSNGQDWVEKK